YAYDLSQEKLFQLTNVSTGAFEPSPSPNGKEMAFIQYHSSGYELHLINTDQLLWKETDQQLPTNDDQADLLLVISNQKFSIAGANSKPSDSNQNQSSLYPIEKSSWTLHQYLPMESIFPTYWTPYLSMTAHDLYFGFSSVAQDQLKFYTIPFKLAYGITNQSLYYDLHFSSSKYNPSFSFSWQGETSFSSQAEAMIHFRKEGYTSDQDSARIYQEQLSLGFHSEQDLVDVEKEEGNHAEMATQKINSLKIKYIYDDTETYQASVGPDIGQNLTLSYQYASPKIGSDLNYHRILWDYRNYVPLFSEQEVLATRLVAGMGFNVSGEESLFSLGGNGIQSLFSSGTPGSFPLRGFPKSSFSGNNLFLATLEYRFPIRTIEHKIGFDWASIFLERITGTLFFDAGHAWNNLSDSKLTIPSLEELNISLGAELNFKFNQSQDQPFVITIGAAKAITEDSPVRFYAQTGLSF
ncbi:MAG: BamA/TamA family outer membrane protein, partial [Candidatus Aminicenantes bacterium]|nr:BamA/TamA family outer membrane protein [Candidatus Aminicenantes bacterium]